MRLLSGDIGGTKTWLQLADFDNGKLTVLAHQKYVSNTYNNAAIMVKEFLSETGHQETHIDGACFAVAGPIMQGRVQLTNLPWDVDEAAVAEELGIRCVTLINDFQAIGYGTDALAEKDLYTLQAGSPRPQATRALIGAGTGLGVALMSNDGEKYTVMPTEGGHVDFGPTNDIQMELLAYLRRKLHRVSVERVLSGQGLINIYKFICDNPLYGEIESRKLQFAMHKEDPAAAISRFAIEEKDPLACRALDIFIDLYGAQAGNLALMSLPYGGIYIVGGIAPKILSQLNDGRFMKAYGDKGRMSRMLDNFPIHIVLDTKIGLKGAALYAARACAQ
ncbi:glucokinase [Piscirickettsia salmonis]|uniref:Glucokinase n=1 Tax=Piscirickettsia salmonis TaxID=1238 RepID=A0A9Q6PVC7_PISSA|nr:glucokinase [Piscirickettsia salmonis]ALA26146.1 glucokinase [Piscirickettsia salmonis]APS43591.1 glucokinase [Piscirickettsia salmonis]APS46945.1 glucokinase [Piscirickettsia salmonis]APS51604.1 glucokinase [Piscirickettsia salmonis]APS54820.1 glucokinase [Piscirickettsia salmonis]